ncbi:MAG: alpha/beta hydrolase [bacterium]|nr:alpha/beta hydrolase [bacterium]
MHGSVLVPARREAPGPAVLYHHQHAKRYAVGKREAISRQHPALGFATGEELARRGFLVLATDAYGFGERRSEDELTLAKRFLWEGRTYWGMIVRDDLLALRYLLGRPDVDPKRVAAMGMSMGSTRSWWAAALDERITRVVSVACLTRYQDLVAAGELRQHGMYYFVPGVLRERIDMEQVIGLIAPRPHLTLTGDSDAGSPVSGVRAINRFEGRLYGLYGKGRNYRGVVYRGVGHEYTLRMWEETLAWLVAVRE